MKKMKLNIQLFGATCTVSVKSITQSIANNSSTITIHGKLSTDSSSYNYGGAYMQPIISNQPVIGTQTSSQTLSKYKYNIGKSSSKEDDWTFTVYHNNNGTCNNLTIQIKWYVSNSTNGTKTLTNGYTPNTIARASTVSASDGTLNVSNDVSISITRQDNSFTHTLRYVCGDDSGWIKDVNNKVSTSANWTPPLSLANQNKTDYSLSCRIYCQTYNGSTPIGDENYDDITLTIPSLSPTATLGTVNDDTSYKSTYGAFIQNKSTIKVSLSGTPQYTDISSYSWEIRQNNSTGTKLKSNSGSYTGSLNISYTPTVSGTLYIKGTVTDKRGASHSTYTTVSVTAYSPPTCSLVVSRVNSTSASYTMSGTGTVISNAGYTANTLEFKLVRGSTTVRSTSDGTSYTGTDTIADQSYTYTLTAKDTISGTTDTKTVTIATTFTLMNFSASGKAMAIGKASEAIGSNSLFEVGMVTKLIPPTDTYSCLNIHSSNRNEASIAYHNQDNTKRYVVGYGTGSYDGFGVYCDETAQNLLKIDKDGNNIATKSFGIPANSNNGYGLVDHANNSIIKDWNNGIITVNATGSTLFLGHQNTSSINILDGKGTWDASGLKIGNSKHYCSTFDLVQNGGGYVRLCRVASSSVGSNGNLYVKAFTGDGWNGRSNQNAMIIAHIKKSYNDMGSALWYGCTYAVYGSNNNNDKVRIYIRATSIHYLDIYLYSPYWYSSGRFELEGQFDSVSNVNDWRSASTPTEGTEQPSTGGLVQTIKSLYDNSDGQRTGTITLSETSANFTYIEIFYKAYSDNVYNDNYGGFSSVKVYQPNGKRVQLTLDYDADNSGRKWYHCFAVWTFNGTSLTKSGELRWRVAASTAAQTRTDTTTDDSNINIVKIIGYR